MEDAQRLQPADCDRLGGWGEKKGCSWRSLLHPCAHGADGAKARSPKRSDGSLRCPTGELKLLAAQHEAGATWPQAALTGPPTAALTAYLGCTSPGEVKEGTRMMRRPQRTEAACGWRRGRRVPLRLP